MIVGVDTIQTDSCLWGSIFDGAAVGQVFEARDTVLLSVSVWRPPDPNGTPLRIYVMEVDSTGKPDIHQILRLGPTLQEGGDGVHAVRYRFDFDPPVILPGLGLYEFAVQVAPDPYCDGVQCLMTYSQNPYPAGAAWYHPRSYPYSGCPLRAPYLDNPNVDLIFEMEFCDTHSTVAVPEGLPASFALYQNQPNPFAASTRFRFDLPRPETVHLDVYDLMGRLVAAVRDAWMPAGRHSVEWNSRDARGSPVRPGTYIYCIRAGAFRAQRKLVVLP